MPDSPRPAITPRTPAKSPLKSKTLWGAFITTSAFFLESVTGVAIDPETQTQLVAHIIDAIVVVQVLVGTVLTVYGRFTATQPISTPTIKDPGALLLAGTTVLLVGCNTNVAHDPAFRAALRAQATAAHSNALTLSGYAARSQGLSVEDTRAQASIAAQRADAIDALADQAEGVDTPVFPKGGE